MKSNTIPLLVAGAIVAAALCTVLLKGGWLIWVPVLLALAVVAGLSGTSKR